MTIITFILHPKIFKINFILRSYIMSTFNWREIFFFIILAMVTSPCSPQASLNGILYDLTNPMTSSYPNYTCYAYTWVATESSATWSFVFRNDPGDWMLDDVSGTTQMIINGSFETGSIRIFNLYYNHQRVHSHTMFFLYVATIQ
jgi:hypothetical protein